MPTHYAMTRRRFLRGLAASAPTIIAAGALGADGRPAPSNRIVMGAIGVGAQGGWKASGFAQYGQVQMVAVCDVDRTRRERVKGAIDRRHGSGTCTAYNDYREITGRDDIDAVLVATPDHWHVLTALAAVRAGKDAYVEKPLSLTIRQGRALADAARRHGVVVQTGSQQRSGANFRQACELVRNGRIGKLHTVRVKIPGNSRRCGLTWQAEPVPAGLDYDRWLGPAPWAPYTQQRCHYSFRFLLDYSGGQLTNWGAHHIDIAQWGIGADDSGPVEVVGDGEFPATGLFTTATRVNFTCTYADGVRLICTSGGSGTQFEGTGGSIYVSRGRLKTTPERVGREPIAPEEIHLAKSSNHMTNFLECVRTRSRCVADVEIGHRSASICHLGNIAMRLRRTLRWDPIAERFDADEEANRMVGRSLREPWRL